MTKVSVERSIERMRQGIEKRFSIEVPHEDITITWKGGDHRIIYLHVREGKVTGSVKEQFYLIGDLA